MRTKRGRIRPLFWLSLALVVGLIAALRRIDAVEVRGRSMVPTLLPGDRLLALRMGRPPRVGEIVLAPDPREPRRELIKRVAGVDVHGIALRGDNPAASTDERTFGILPASATGWRIVVRYWPRGRIGVLPDAPARMTRVDEGGEAACTVPEALLSRGRSRPAASQPPSG